MGEGGQVVTPDRLEQLIKCMEVLLSDVEQLRGYCGHNMTELTRMVLELRQERRELAEKYEALSRDMQWAMDTMAELQDTKFAFSAKVRQAQKLNRQL